MSIKVKRGLAINLPILEEGELGFTTDSYEMYVGSDNGNILLNNGEILIRRNNGMLQYAQSSRKNQWFDICSLEEIRGDQGIQGIQGIQGVKGDKGDKGERGIQGEKGNPFTYADFTPDQLRALKGEKGDTGAKGERGLTGDKGDRGVGLNYSWSGTRLGVKRDTDAQYTYVDLRGADGRDGKQGERGERGIQGEKGETPSIAHLEVQVANKSKELDTKFNTLTAKQQQDAEVVTARDGEVSLHARLERDLGKGKIHFVDVEGSIISTESEEGYLENVEILGNTWQDAENLADIRSVGTKVEGQELYEIPVLSCGKNLFDGEFVQGSLMDSNGEVGTNLTGVSSKDFIKINNTSINYIWETPIATLMKIYCYKSNYEYISSHTYTSTLTTNGVGKLSLPSETRYIKFRLHSTNNITPIDDITVQIEEGTKATPYEPYQEDKLTILSPTPLEKVGDVADRIVCKDGIWGVEKNIGNLVVDGSTPLDSARVSSVNAELIYAQYSCFDSLIKSYSVHTIASGFIGGKGFNADISAPPYSACATYSSSKLRFLIPIADIVSADDKGVSNYFKSKPCLVKYIANQPQFIPLLHDQQIKLRTFANKTHIHFETEIEGTIKAQVPKSLGATVNTHTTQIDNLNKELDRVKKLEESTVSTVTSSKAFTNIAETTQGYFEDVKIEGKTLVNKILNNHKALRGLEDTGIKYVDYQVQVKPSTEYTVVLSISKNTSSPNTSLWGAYIDGATQGIHNICKQSTSIINVGGTLGMYALKFTTKDSITNSPRMVIGLHSDWGVYEFEADVMLLEGDHTDKDITFFEGLKSVGQYTDEISVSSVNENPINFDSVTRKGSKGVFEVNYIENSVTISRLNDMYYEGAIFEAYLDKGNHIISFDRYPNNIVCVFEILDKNMNRVYLESYSDPRFTINNSGKYYIGIYKQNIESSTVTISNIRIDNITTKHQSNKKQILYFNPTTQTWEKPILREWDSIEKHSDGKYYYHKRSEEVTFDGSETWSVGSSYSDSIRYYVPIPNIGKLCINNKFITLTSSNMEGITIASDRIYIELFKSKAQDVAGFKQWLQANNVTVVYQLAQEEVYECTNLDLITYPDETNLIVNSGVIQPRITLKVLSNVSNVVKLLQEKVSILENKFIKGLQQVLAGDMMSLAHLLYPEDFALENDTPQVIPYIEEGDINE